MCATFLHNLLFVCTEIHNREHLPQKSLLQGLELLLSSKKDPCRALLLHMTPSPLGIAAPDALNHMQYVLVLI